MTKRRKPPLALWLTASLLVAALIGALIGALITANSGAPDEEVTAPAGVVSRPAPSGSTAPDLPSGLPSLAPVIAPAHAPQTPLTVAPLRVGAPLIVLAVVNDETGAPVTAFDVTLLPLGSEPPLERLKTTEIAAKPFRGPSGIFRTDCPPGRWDVVVRAGGYLPGVLPDVVVPADLPGAVQLRLSHGPSITGLVYDETRSPVPDVPVFLDVVRLFNEGRPPQVLISRTGSDGRFRFSPLPAGEYSVTLLEPINERDKLRSVTVNQGTTDVSLFLTPRHQLVISVRDSYGRPVSDADIELRSSVKFATGRTRESGQAVLRFLPDGAYSVSVKREGYEPLAETLQLQGGQGEQVRWYTLTEPG